MRVWKKPEREREREPEAENKSWNLSESNQELEVDTLQEHGNGENIRRTSAEEPRDLHSCFRVALL